MLHILVNREHTQLLIFESITRVMNEFSTSYHDSVSDCFILSSLKLIKHLTGIYLAGIYLAFFDFLILNFFSILYQLHYLFPLFTLQTVCIVILNYMVSYRIIVIY